MSNVNRENITLNTIMRYWYAYMKNKSALSVLPHLLLRLLCNCAETASKYFSDIIGRARQLNLKKVLFLLSHPPLE